MTHSVKGRLQVSLDKATLGLKVGDGGDGVVTWGLAPWPRVLLN
jgi:hypothetical protein